MKRIVKPFSHKLFVVYRIELVLSLLIALLLAGGSLYAILRSDKTPLFRLGGSAAVGGAGSGGSGAVGRSGGPGSGDALTGNELSVFTGIGQIRIPISGAVPAATMVLSIAFPYPPNDGPFVEELASKIPDFKTITTDYFSSLPADAISNLNEEAAKAELLKRYNAILRLGVIGALYFSDLLIIE
jgi:flagellar basal body-associated protein FliL